VTIPEEWNGVGITVQFRNAHVTDPIAHGRFGQKLPGRCPRRRLHPQTRWEELCGASVRCTGRWAGMQKKFSVEFFA
jgi:hypothetical protein